MKPAGLVIPAEGENPLTIIPQMNVDRGTTTDAHFGAPNVDSSETKTPGELGQECNAGVCPS